jgi:hypothetical protein
MITCPRMRTPLLAACVVGAFSSASSRADVVLTFSDGFVGGSGALQLLENPGAALVGTVTGITMDAVLTQSSTPNVQARYAMLYFGAPIAGFLATVGSVSNPFPYPSWVNPQWYPWADGASGAPGTPLTARIDFDQQFGASSISGLAIAMPSAGYNDWVRLTGSLTIHGVSFVPAPSVALTFGFVGLSRSRRRA